jgi:hypothetical protein
MNINIYIHIYIDTQIYAQLLYALCILIYDKYTHQENCFEPKTIIHLKESFQPENSAPHRICHTGILESLLN